MNSITPEFFEYFNNLTGKNWAEICWEEEDREEEESRIENEIRLKELDMERKIMYLNGEYELEDGEIFE